MEHGEKGGTSYTAGSDGEWKTGGPGFQALLLGSTIAMAGPMVIGDRFGRNWEN